MDYTKPLETLKQEVEQHLAQTTVPLRAAPASTLTCVHKSHRCEREKAFSGAMKAMGTHVKLVAGAWRFEATGEALPYSALGYIENWLASDSDDNSTVC